MSWTVLLVEDDSEIQEMLRRVLDARGLRLLVAANGAEAIDVVTRSGTRPSVILLDLHMPIMDGAELLRHQPTVPLLADVPVIIVSASTLVPDPLPPTVYAVMTKPTRLADLLEAIRGAVGALRPIGPRPTLSGPVAALKPAASAEPQPGIDEPAIDEPDADLPAMAADAPSAPAIGEPPSDGVPELKS